MWQNSGRRTRVEVKWPISGCVLFPFLHQLQSRCGGDPALIPHTVTAPCLPGLLALEQLSEREITFFVKTALSILVGSSCLLNQHSQLFANYCIYKLATINKMKRQFKNLSENFIFINSTDILNLFFVLEFCLSNYWSFCFKHLLFEAWAWFRFEVKNIIVYFP